MTYRAFTISGNHYHPFGILGHVKGFKTEISCNKTCLPASYSTASTPATSSAVKEDKRESITGDFKCSRSEPVAQQGYRTSGVRVDRSRAEDPRPSSPRLNCSPRPRQRTWAPHLANRGTSRNSSGPVQVRSQCVLPMTRNTGHRFSPERAQFRNGDVDDCAANYYSYWVVGEPVSPVFRFFSTPTDPLIQRLTCGPGGGRLGPQAQRPESHVQKHATSLSRRYTAHVLRPYPLPVQVGAR